MTIPSHREAHRMLMLTDPPDPTFWDYVQQAASFAVVLLTIVVTGGAAAKVISATPWWKTRTARKARERARVDAERREQLLAQINEVVAPIREQVEQIHRTTHVNGGRNNPPTLRDEVNNVGKQVETAIEAVGQVAANQSRLVDRMDSHEDEGEKYLGIAREALKAQGIDLPAPRPELPRTPPDADI